MIRTIAFVIVLAAAASARAQQAAPKDCASADQCTKQALEAVQRKDFAAASAPLRRACDFGVPDACYGLGAMSWTGSGVARDPDAARRLMKRACELGEAKGCDALKTIDAPAPPDHAALCAKGDLDACVEQAAALVEKDSKQAFAIAKRACDGGRPRGCSMQAIATSYLGARGWKARTVTLFQRACDGGDSFGCRELGSMYAEGTGVAQDDDRARALFEQACGDHDPDPLGCDKAAERAYMDGHFDRELVFGARACAQDDADGCDHVGVADQHRGDWAGSATAYDHACTLGGAHACSMMSSWYGPSGGNPTIQPDADRAKAYDAKLRAAQAKAK